MRHNIMFSSLRAEMARNGVTIEQIAKEVGVCRETMSRKLSGKSDLKLNEALLISKKFFPNVSVWDLFSELECKSQAG